MLQRKSRDEGSENGLKVCSWRWRGYLIQVSVLFILGTVFGSICVEGTSVLV